MAAANFHATGLVVGDRGLLIAGASGTGKTTLALALIARFGGPHRHARLIADDQLLLSAAGGRLIATAPPQIAGLVEVYGLGPRPIASQPRAIVDLLVRLVPAAEAQRLPEPSFEVLAGCRVPSLELAARNAEGAANAVAAWLSCPSFDAAACR